jgi:serine/threonine protein kinase/WD40 repeat protein/tetratricopeptide (TPR) repeat protein
MQEQSLFIEALEKADPAERAAFLERACAGDLALRQRIERLLACHQEGSGFLEAPATPLLPHQPAAAADLWEPAATAAPAPFLEPVHEGPGTVIGPYKLLEQIGEGGFGVVYMAEQHQPMRRKVALKILKPGMESAQVIARFEAERQALALMDHPNIAHVLDAGATATGRPYVVMELVKGVPITDFCDQASLASRERLELFVHVCQAVQHAHQKGIIHRDLKPSNVLVTLHDGTPVVKVIDFGIAKALGQQLTDKTLYTGFAQLLGTPLYMSPEQAALSGLDVDTRSDIYSLGVLLYELLTGTTPFDKERLRAAGYEEMRRIIREEEPPRPSTRLSTLGQAATLLAGQRRSDPKRLSQLCRGELDWIVMKALEKDRGRRYETAAAFAADVQRYLKDEPVQACPPSAGYRLRKILRRHKGPVLAAALVLLALVTGVAVSTWQAVRAMQAEGDAVAGWADAEEQRGAADANLQKALAAERAKTEKLWQAKLAQAQAGRWSGRAGRVFDSLQALAEAAQIARSVNAPEEYMVKLRNEAIACMVLPDLRHRPEFDKYGYDIFSTDGTRGALDRLLERCASSDDQGTITIRRVGDDREIARLEGPGTRPSYMDFSPDGQLLAAVYPSDPENKGGQLLIWHVGRREITMRLAARRADLRPVWSPDGRRFTVYHASSPAMIALYDVDSRTQIQGFPNRRPDLAFDPSGKQLAVARDDTVVQIRDIETGRLLDQFAFPVPIARLTWGADGRFLAARCIDGRTGPSERRYIYVWDVPARRLHTILKGHTDLVVDVALSHAGDLLASTSFDGTIRLWNPWTGKELLSSEEVIWGHRIEFSPDDRFLTVAGMGRRWWEVKTGRALRTLYHEAEGAWFGSVSFSANGRWLASADPGGFRLWDLATLRPVALLATGGNGPVRFERNATSLLTAFSAGLFRWPFSFDQGEKQQILRVGPPERLDLTEGRARSWDERDLAAAQQGRALSPDGRWAATGSRGGGAKLLDARSGKLIRRLTTDDASVCFSPDGKWLVTGSEKEFVLWEVGSWRTRVKIARARGYGPGIMAFSPDGMLLAVANARWDVQLIDPATGRQVATLPNPDYSSIENLAFSSDGSQLGVVTGASGRRTVWGGELRLLDLRGIRRQLAQMGLDWELPTYRAAPPWQEGGARPVKVQVDLGGQFIDREMYSLVLAFFPFHAEAYYQRGLAYLQRGQLEAAQGDFDRTVLLKPDHAGAHYQRGMCNASRKEFQAASADFSRAIALDPKHAAAYAGRAYTHLELEQYAEAVADFSKAEALGQWDKAAFDLGEAVAGPNPGKATIAYWLALARLGAGDLVAYRSACAEMARRFGPTEDPDAAFWLAWAGAIGPDALADHALLVRWAEEALAPAAKSFDNLNTLGAALYRAGRFKEALQRLEEAHAAYNPGARLRQPIVYNWLFQAMAQHALGHGKEAGEWLQKAVGWMDEVAQDKGSVPMPWNRRLTLRLLRREAETLLQRPATEPRAPAQLPEGPPVTKR